MTAEYRPKSSIASGYPHQTSDVVEQVEHEKSSHPGERKLLAGSGEDKSGEGDGMPKERWVEGWVILLRGHWSTWGDGAAVVVPFAREQVRKGNRSGASRTIGVR